MTQTELLLTNILTELCKLTVNLTTEAIVLSERTPSEHDDMLKAKIRDLNKAVALPSTSFMNISATSQPAPPPLPSSVRMKWTPDYEQLIHDCAAAPHGTYRNSVKRLTDKLPEGVTISSIRNKCNSLGYKIHKKYLVHK